jgi:hypothetical protein
MQASAHDAHEHILASAGALAFLNEYAESAAPPALYKALAEHQQACPLALLYHTLGEHICSHKPLKHVPPGLDWADATHDICLPATGTARREFLRLAHRPAAIDAWGQSLRTRFNGHPLAVCLALNTGPMVSALRPYDFLVLFPVHPLPVAK